MTTLQFLFSSLILIVSLLQIIFAGYISLLDSKSPGMRTLSGLLLSLAIVNIANNILQSTTTLREATPWLAILLAGSKAIGPLIYLSSVAILRPVWLEKYSWLYRSVLWVALIPIFFILCDLFGLSQSLFGITLLLSLPDPVQFTNISDLVQTANGGFLHNIFFAVQTGFPFLTLLCPGLVVAWKDRKSDPKNSQIALLFFIVVLSTSLLEGLATRYIGQSLTTFLSALTFFILSAYIILKLTNFDEQMRRIQIVFRNWSIFAKLIGAITVIIVIISLAIGITSFTVLRMSTIRSEGSKLSNLARAETRNIGDELLNELSQLQDLAQNEIASITINTQNDQYSNNNISEKIQEELANSELSWQTSDIQTLTENFLLRYPVLYNVLLDFQNRWPDHQLIYFTDKYGVVITGTSPPDRYHAQQFNWWKFIIKDDPTSIYISPIFYNTIAQEYYIEISIPVKNSANETIGALYSRYNLKTLLNHVANIQYGGTGKAVLFNGLGYQIPNTPEQSPVDIGINWERLNHLAQPWQILPYQEEESLVAWIQLDDLYSSGSLENLNWRFVFLQSKQEILSPLRLISLTSNIIIISTIFISIFLAAVLARFITYPLNRLNQNAKLISQGNLSTRVENLTNDEFGRLASSFNTMTDQLQALIGNLESQVDERTQALQQRANQIRAAVDIGNTVASIREINELLPLVTQLISERFGFYHVGIFLLDEHMEYAILKAANSPGGQHMLARHHKLKVGEVGIVGFVAKNKLPRIALDVGEDAVYFDNPDLPGTRSEMALPILATGKIIGVLDVQSTEPQAFIQEDIEILQLLADQLSIAIENANLNAINQAALAETQIALEAARRAYQDVSREGWKNLGREVRSLAYRATEGKILTSIGTPSQTVTHTARVGHPTLPTPDTLALPIKIQDQVAGVVQLKKQEAENWSAKEINFIETIVSQLGTAIESARLYKETQSTLIRTEALYQVGRAATSYEKTEDLLLAVADTIAGTLPAHRVLIVTLDFPGEKVLHFIENNASPQEITPGLFHFLMNGLTGWSIQNRQPTLSPKNNPDPREGPDAQKQRSEQQLGSMLVVPMFYQDRPIGTITAINKIDENDFSKEDVELLIAMANQLGASLINAELLLQTQQRALQLQTSAEISRAISSILDLEQLLPQVVELIRSRFEFYYVGLFLIDEIRGSAILRAGTGSAGQNLIAQNYYFPMDSENDISRSISSNQGQILLDIGVEATTFDYPYLPDTRSEIILPLMSRTRSLGALTIQSHLPNAFSPSDLNVFQTMADQIASAIDNAILFESNNRRLETSNTLLEITQVVSTSIHLDQILREITLRTAKITRAYRCMVYLLDDHNYIQPSTIQFSDGHSNPKQWELFKSHSPGVLSEVPLFANAIQHRQPILLKNVQENLEDIPNDWIKAFHQQTILCIPLISQDKGIGILLLDQISSTYSFNKEQIDLAVTVAGQAAAIIQNAQLFQEQEKRSQEIKQLNEVSLELSQLQMDLTPAINTLSSRAMELLNSDGGEIWFWIEETQELELIHTFQSKGENLVGRRLKPGEGLAGIALETRQLQVVDDYVTWKDQLEPFTELSFHAALAVPLIQHNEILGVLALNRSQPGRPYTPDQQNLALLLANQTGSYIRTARLFQQIQESLARERRERNISGILAHAAEKFGAATSEQELRKIMIGEIHDVILPDQISLYEWQDDNNALKVDVRLTPGDQEDDYSSGQLIEADTRPDLWTVFSSQESLYEAQQQPDGLLKEHFIVPWMIGGQTSGVIEMFHTARSLNIRVEDQESIRGIIRQAAVALLGTRLFEQTQEALMRTEALFQVSQAAAAVESLPVLLQSIVDRIAESLPADRVLLITLDLESQQVTGFVESGLPTGSIVPLAFEELMNGLTGWVIQERKATLSPKHQKDKREADDVYQHRIDAGDGSIIVVPLIYREQIFGTITATNELDNPDFSMQDVNLLTAMANQAAAAIENARLFNQAQRRALLLQTAAEVSNAASSILELDQLLSEVVELIRERFDLYYVGLFLVDDIRRYAVLRAGSGEAGRLQIEQGHQLRLNDQSMIGRCIVEYQAQIAQEIGTETVFFRNPFLPETRSELALPLAASGQTLGAMTIQSVRPAAFSPDDITVLETLADQLAVAIENARFMANTRIRAENEQLLNQITSQFSNSLDLETILQTAIKEIGLLPRVREVAIHVGDRQSHLTLDELEELLTESQQDIRLPLTGKE